jgi:hypothetical protein
MKPMLSLAALALLLVGCKTPDNTVYEPAGAQRPWEPAQVDWNHSAVPVNPSTDTDKHVWTQSPIPTVPSKHDPWRSNH